MCPGAPNGPHNRHVSSVVAEAMPGDWVTLGGPGHPCSDDSWNPVRANLHLQACERKQLLRIRFQTDSKHPVHGNIHCPLQRPREKKALKQTQCSQLIAWSSPLSSFSSTNQTVNGVCSFQTACDFFFPATVVSELSLVP